eukprot:snap_masked-scaffold_46-processed-gene-1.77-mRNA-1 protein AED:1.00 eAED:1.00 QI:0/-1/0/0/-1/1/1/0/180
MLRTHYLSIQIYTDHKVILAVLRTEHTVKQDYWEVLFRWSLQLQQLTLVVHHIPSRRNFLADILIRRGAPEANNETSTIKFTKFSSFNSDTEIDQYDDFIKDYLEDEIEPFLTIRRINTDDSVSLCASKDTILTERLRPTQEKLRQNILSLLNPYYGKKQFNILETKKNLSKNRIRSIQF